MKQDHARILIVDDTQESIDLLVYFLKPTGYRVLTATNGYKALEIINATPPDLILLDVMMPEIDGYEICERVKKDPKTQHIPVIMITALRELKDKITGLEAGADDFISKPYDSVELLARVKSLLRMKRYHDQLREQNRRLEEQKKALEREEVLKRELTNLLVHDMKSPLFVIQGQAQMMNLMANGDTQAESVRYAERIDRNSRGLLRMILNLLDVSRLEQNAMDLQMSPVDLNRSISEQLVYFKDLPGNESKSVCLALNNALPKIRVDYNIFERIMDNLLNVAFHNTPENGEVFIISGIGENGAVELRIRHAGEPIPEAYHEKVFSKYAANELKKAGFKLSRGLGLIACRLALEANQASIRIDPDYQDGVGYLVTLPAWENDPAMIG
ncbi:MAG TPA: response regulator [Calditrichia bacterium]|nr:response regulator [Calditrichota bacterium]HQV31545.1 response regulator [Calditrichia bacterium]